MATTKIQIKDWPRYMARLGARAHVALQRGLVAGAQRCIPILQRRTEQAVPASERGHTGAYNTGAYRRLWRWGALALGSRVWNDATYAGVIDGGRRPGTMPPLRAIQQWAQRRLGLTGRAAARAAYPIARAIARRGLRPRRVLGGATAELGAAVTAECNRELAVELRR